MKRLFVLVLLAESIASAVAQPGGSNHTVMISPIHLKNLSVRGMITQYSTSSDRTPIIAPGLPEATFSLDFTPPILTSEVARMITNALAEKDILVIPDGRIFALVVPKSWEKTVHPMASQIHNSTISPTNRMVKYNDFDLHSATIAEVLKVYATLARAKIDPESPTNFPDTKISFITYHPTTREETMYALRTLLLWNNVKINFIGPGLISAEPIPPK